MQKTVQYIRMKITISKNPFSLSEMFFVTGVLKDGIIVNGFCYTKKERTCLIT